VSNFRLTRTKCICSTRLPKNGLIEFNSRQVQDKKTDKGRKAAISLKRIEQEIRF
jgi:hypothetical protein